jgi:hypothetical protein
MIVILGRSTSVDYINKPCPQGHMADHISKGHMGDHVSKNMWQTTSTNHVRKDVWKTTSARTRVVRSERSLRVYSQLLIIVEWKDSVSLKS